MKLGLTTLERVASHQFAKSSAVGVTKDAAAGGVMVAWYPPAELAAELALPGYETSDELHVTLAYVAPDATQVDVDAVLAAAKHVALNMFDPRPGQLAGEGRFVAGTDVGQDVFFLTVDVPGLEDIHCRIWDALCSNFVWGSEETYKHGFIPHMTLAYLNPAEPNPARLAAPIPIEIDTISVVAAGSRVDFPVGPQTTSDAEVEGPADDAVYQMVKANEEKRYTLGVMYAPNVKDAHGEYVEDGDLHDAVIDFMRAGDKRLKLMHDPSVAVGDIVEMMRWPYPVDIDVARPGEESRKVTVPAGTIFMGVIWDAEVWPYVKDGTIGGYSMGGRAIRVEGDDVPELGKDALGTGDLSSVSVDQRKKPKRQPVGKLAAFVAELTKQLLEEE